MFAPDKPWKPDLNWQSPAGETLQALIRALPDAPLRITVFGSAPLQLALDAAFLSADVDIFSSQDLRDVIRCAGLGRGQREIYVQQNDEIVFRAASSWQERAYIAYFGAVSLVFPHPIDILIAKLPRLEPKDLAAFRLVLHKTGHPTAPELQTALQRAVDLFRPAFDEENSGDPIANTRQLWRELFGAEIDVHREIIRPALERRRDGYQSDAPEHRQSLRAIAENKGDSAS